MGVTAASGNGLGTTAMGKHSRPRSAWGSVSEIDKGRRYRIRYWAETPDGYRRCSETVRGTRRDAYDRLAALQLDHSHDAPCPTVGQCWERWFLPDFERRVSEGDAARSTVAQYRSVWRRHIAPTWADVPADEVRPLAVQQWIASMTRSQATPAVHVMRRVLDYAVRYECMAANPMDAHYLMPARSTSARRDDGIWTLDELGRLWESVRGAWYEPAFLLMAFGGCRVGEALGPLASDVSAERVGGAGVTLVRIGHQVTNDNRYSDVLKNRWSYRTVAVPGSPGARIAGLAQSADGPYLTGDGLGGFARQDVMRREWDSLMRSFSPSHPMKQLRPSWQTYMRWELCVPPYLIEPMMGHVGHGVTGAHYDKPVAEQFAEAVARAYREHPFDAGWPHHAA